MSKNGTRPGSLSIIGDGMPGSTVVELDGRDITRAVSGVTVEIDVDSKPTALLNVLLFDVSTHLDNPCVVIPDATRELLVQLGWKPPQDDETEVST